MYGKRIYWKTWKGDCWNMRQQESFWQILRKNLEKETIGKSSRVEEAGARK